MLGELDTFPFILAREYGYTLAQVREMPHADYIALRAFTVYERAVRRMHAEHQAQLNR